MGPSGRHDDPCSLSGRPQGQRADGPTLWDQVDFRTATLHVRRVKQGTPSTHPILGDELRMLRRLRGEQELKSAFVFTSERGSPFTTAGFARMVERAGVGRSLGSRPIPTCSGMPAGARWPPRGTTPAPFRPTSGTRTSSTRCGTPSCRRPGSTTSGVIDGLNYH
jgi:hypothetical protein